MYRKSIYLISFVLVLGLAGHVLAQDAEIPAAGTPAPVIDGTKEAAWSASEEHKVLNVVVGIWPPSNDADLSISWWALWDSDYLYILVDVNDNDLKNDTFGTTYQDDSVEIMLDMGNDKLYSYGEDDELYIIAWDAVDPAIGSFRHGGIGLVGVEFAVLTKGVGGGEGGRGTGYTVEIKLPWTSLYYPPEDVNAVVGELLGLDFNINDDDAPGDTRDNQMCWHDTTADAWDNPSLLGTVELVAGLKAFNPDPRNDATGVLAGLLQWTAGEYADTHDVYFGTNPTPGAGESKGNQPGTTYLIQYPADIAPATMYYWRIDEVNEAGPDPCFWEGNVWSFTSAPLTAHSPDPCNGAQWVDVDTDLSWGAGLTANTHDVYLDTDETKVTDANRTNQLGVLVKQDHPTTTFDPGALQPNTTYYWRIDEVEVNPATIHRGEVWHFTALGAGVGIKGEYYDNADLSDPPALTRIDDTIDFAWGYDSPDPCLPVDGFSIRWTAELEVPFTENYTFIANWSVGDVVRLWIDGQLIIDEWVGGEYGGENSATIDLVAGKAFLVMEYADGTAGAAVHLSWESPSIPQQIIPKQVFSLPVRSTSPSPSNGVTDVRRDPNLSWKPGPYAGKHDVYLGTDFDIVKDANRTNDPYSVLVDINEPNNYYKPGNLEFNTTYYWRIDDVNVSTGVWKGSVWSFTTGNYLVVDDFESYNPDLEDTWIAGGKAEVSLSTDPAHESAQAMAIDYNNAALPYYSEANAITTGPNSLEIDINWRLQDVKALSLRFQGYPILDGSFSDAGGIYTMKADGANIWGTADQFHYAYKRLSGSGAGSIVARVDAMNNTDPSAKAGVMIRNTLDPNSEHAMVVVTPTSGVSFQYRGSAGGITTDANTTTEITAPYWVKLERGTSGFTAFICDDANYAEGPYWMQIGGTIPIFMEVEVYIGLCLTSHNSAVMCAAQLSGVTMTGTITGSWSDLDIGIPYNAPEPMYVALEDSDSNAIVYHPDPNVTQTGTWTEWRIDLNDFSNVDLDNVQRMYIGFGNKGSPTLGGSGLMHFDNIRLYRPEFVPGKLPPIPGDIVYDGFVGYADLDVLTDNWLISDYNVMPVPPGTTNLVAYYDNGTFNDNSGKNNHGTPSEVSTVVDPTRGNVASFDGINDYVDLPTGMVDSNAGSVCVWIKTTQTTVGMIFYGGEDPNEGGTAGTGGSNDGFGGENELHLHLGDIGTGSVADLYDNLMPGIAAFFLTGAGRLNIGSAVDDNSWHHLAATWDTAGGVQLYLDGALMASAAHTGSAFNCVGRILLGRPNAVGRYYSGLMDDIRIYNCALSQAEVASLAGETTLFTQPLYLLLTPTDPNINVYDDSTIDFKDFAEFGKHLYEEQAVWPEW